MTECGSHSHFPPISQDKAKLKVHKRSDPIEPEVINNMVRYARKCVAQFRALKSSKNILHRHKPLQ